VMRPMNLLDYLITRADLSAGVTLEQPGPCSAKNVPRFKRNLRDTNRGGQLLQDQA